MFASHEEKYKCFFHPITTVKYTQNIQQDVFHEGNKQFRRGVE